MKSVKPCPVFQRAWHWKLEVFSWPRTVTTKRSVSFGISPIFSFASGFSTDPSQPSNFAFEPVKYLLCSRRRWPNLQTFDAFNLYCSPLPLLTSGYADINVIIFVVSPISLTFLWICCVLVQVHWLTGVVRISAFTGILLPRVTDLRLEIPWEGRMGWRG